MRKNVLSWKLTAILFGGAMLLTGCSHDMDNYKPYDVTDEDRVKYAEEKLGVTIDPNQDWVLTDECNVTINADASLEGISMVAVLDGNPYAGITQVMASSPSSRDAKTSLSFRAPQGAEYLYAACMTNDGKCVARPFVPGQETTVTFKEAPVAYSQVASTRATEMVIVNPPHLCQLPHQGFRQFPQGPV